MIKLIDIELNRFPDKDPKRIFVGGLSMGGSLALAVYFRTKV